MVYYKQPQSNQEKNAKENNDQNVVFEINYLKTHLSYQNFWTSHRTTSTSGKISQIVNIGKMFFSFDYWVFQIWFTSICNWFGFITWVISFQHFSKTHNQFVTHFIFNFKQKPNVFNVIADYSQILSNLVQYCSLWFLLNPITSITSFNDTTMRKGKMGIIYCGIEIAKANWGKILVAMAFISGYQIENIDFNLNKNDALYIIHTIYYGLDISAASS